MATPLKTLPPLAQLLQVTSFSDDLRRLSTDLTRWLSRERNSTNELHQQLCRVPAPTFFEAERAAWFLARFKEFGWAANIDRAGNVLATFGDGQNDLRPFVVSAHLDTVFAPQRPEDVHYTPDGRLVGPGVSDNGSGLTALLTLARLLPLLPELSVIARSILLVANVGEEGEGNLSGMRYLCRQPAQTSHIRGFLVLDGPSIDHVTTQALGSRRLEIVFQGPGGHSWNDSGTPNPVHALAHAISLFAESAEARRTSGSRFSYNFGLVEGGVSINSIPASARAKIDLRSEDVTALEELSALLSSAVERSLDRENRNSSAPSGLNSPIRLIAKIRDLGFRPGGSLPSDSTLFQTIRMVDQFLQIRSRTDCASTDANVPLSLSIPAVSIGAGGHGGGAHTPNEWYSPEGRDLGLQRIVLILAALVHPPA